MFGGFSKGLNIKSLAFATVAVFVFFFGTDFLVHGILLKDCYLKTASLWRSQAEMDKYGWWMVLSHLLIAKFFTLLFAKGYEGKGIPEGLRFGFLIGCYAVGGVVMQYVVTPIPRSIFAAWVATTIVQSILGGVVASLVYKKKSRN